MRSSGGFLANESFEWLASFDYTSTSHTFNRAVIAAYNNVERYGIDGDHSKLIVKQQQRQLVFALQSPLSSLPKHNKPTLIFSENEQANATKTKEICYNLESISPSLARGVRFGEDSQVEIADFNGDERILTDIYNDWVATKNADPKVFKMAFNPRRYYRSFCLTKHGFRIFEQLILIKGKQYALIAFAIENDRAYELAFISRYKDPDLRLLNAQNDHIMCACLYKLYNMGIRVVNLGTSAGIKGLTTFKTKHEFNIQTVWTTKVE